MFGKKKRKEVIAEAHRLHHAKMSAQLERPLKRFPCPWCGVGESYYVDDPCRDCSMLVRECEKKQEDLAALFVAAGRTVEEAFKVGLELALHNRECVWDAVREHQQARLADARRKAQEWGLKQRKDAEEA